jgi:hypothetical protein
MFGSAYLYVLAPVCIRLAVTVEAKESKVFDPIVVVDPVDVINVEYKLLAPPLRPVAPSAFIFEKFGFEQSLA